MKISQTTTAGMGPPKPDAKPAPAKRGVKVHELKISKEYMDAIIRNRKTFEVRRNDRGFIEGDVLALNEIDGTGEYTGRWILVVVTYVLDDPSYCKEGYVILSIDKASKALREML